MPSIFDPLELRSIKLRNRIGLSPMCTYSAQDGQPALWHLMHYGARAAGGCGLVMTEATAVEPDGRISLGDCGLWNDRQVCGWRKVNRFISSLGAISGVQLAHAGRKAGGHTPQSGRGPLANGEGWQPVAPSPVPFGDGWPVPHGLNTNALDQLLSHWGAATRRARAAEFDVLEIHMAHGYLLHEFLSPLANFREDEFGGDLDGRMQFPLMVAQQVRLEWPDNLPLIVRISATDWVEGGWTIADSVEFAKRLLAIGVDLIDCSSGGIVPNEPSIGAVVDAQPGFQVSLAQQIKQETGIATAAVGLITDVAQAEAIITEGSADLVFLGRELLRNPHWPLHAAAALGQDIDWPLQYQRARITS